MRRRHALAPEVYSSREVLDVRDAHGSVDSETAARLTVDQYEAMVNSGVFTKRDRFTLINGFLVAKVPKSPRHTFVGKNLVRKFQRLIPSGWDFPIEDAVRLADSKPEPDVSVGGAISMTTRNATRGRLIWRWWSRSPRRTSRRIAGWPASTGRPGSLFTGSLT